MEKSRRWGILGNGRVTHRMVQAIRAAGDQITMVAGRNPARLSEWSNQFQVERTTTDCMELLQSPDVDIVYNALPPSLHFEWTNAALSLGKPVLCEKPLCTESHQATVLAQTSEQSGVMAAHATAFPYHSRSREMRRILESGRIGRMSRVTVSCTFSHVLHRGTDHRTDATQGGGCLLDLGWYCIFATLWFTGQRPIDIRAFGTRLEPGNPSSAWKSVQAIAVLDDHSIAHWDCGYDAAGRKWMEVAGDQGSLICDDFLRPWDIAKPRFWVHGHDGKAEGTIVGADEFQEALMVQSIGLPNHRTTLPDPPYGEPIGSIDTYTDHRELLRLGVETQRILERWQAAIVEVV